MRGGIPCLFIVTEALKPEVYHRQQPIRRFRLAGSARNLSHHHDGVFDAC